MSNKNRTRKTRTTSTTGSSRNLRSVPDQGTAAKVRTDTEDKLWTALQANPNNAAPFLAGVANIGRSTAAKILAKWAKYGSVTRTPGIAEGNRRAADLWAITNTDTDVGTEPTTDHTPTDDTSASDADSADSTQPDPSAPDTTAPETTVADAKVSDAQPADSDPTEATSTEVIDTTKAEPGVEATTPAADSTATNGDTAAIEMINHCGDTVATSKFGTDQAGYAEMLAAGRRFADRVWAVEGCNGIGRHIAHRLVHTGDRAGRAREAVSAGAGLRHSWKAEPIAAIVLSVINCRNGLRVLELIKSFMACQPSDPADARLTSGRVTTIASSPG